MDKIFSLKMRTKHKTLRQIDENIETVIFLDKPSNPLSCQGIKFGEKIYRLIYFEKSSSNLSYEFEKGVSLKFYSRSNAIIIKIVNPRLKIDVVKIWPEIYSKNWTSATWNNITEEMNYINNMCKELNYISVVVYDSVMNV